MAMGKDQGLRRGRWAAPAGGHAAATAVVPQAARPPPRCHGQGGRAHRAGGRAARDRWGERGVAQGGEKKRRIRLKSMEDAHRGRRPSPEPRENPSIAGDSGIQSTNRTRCNEALDETNAAVPSDSSDDARIGSNCSLELSPELEPPRTSASNTGS
jgi:hypothetical protein